jgi:hypothetical protein
MADRLTLPYQASSYSSYPQAEGLLQPQQSSGQRQGSRSPYSAPVPFPEPHRGSASHPQTYIPPSQNTPNLTVPTHHHARRGSHGHSPVMGSSSDSQRLYPVGAGSDTGGGSNFYPPAQTQTTPNLTVPTSHHARRGSHGHSPVMGSSSDSQRLYPLGAGSDTAGGSNFYPQPGVQPGVQPYGGGFTDTTAQPHDWNTGGYDGGHDSRSKAPPVRPASHRSN